MSDGACEHDWRVNPHVVLTSNPPQRLLVCAKCGTQRPSGISEALARHPQSTHNPHNWEKWK